MLNESKDGWKVGEWMVDGQMVDGWIDGWRDGWLAGWWMEDGRMDEWVVGGQMKALAPVTD